MAESATAKKSRRRKKSRKRSNLNPWLIGGGIALLIALPIVINAVRSSSLPGVAVANLGNTHIATVDTPHAPYNSNPPTSGPHVGSLVSWRSYDYVVPDENLIHNLEDGGIVLWYKMGTPEENQVQISKLEAASRGYRRVVVTPREDLETDYAITAWQRIDKFNADEFSEERVQAFLRAFEGIDRH